MEVVLLAIVIFAVVYLFVKKWRFRLPQLFKNFFLFKNSLNNTLKQKQPLNNDLEQRLLRLLYGDKKMMKRLIEHGKKKNPGYSENWYYEKAISDLESDRR